MQRIDALAAISETDDGLDHRTFGSDAMRRANALVGGWMRAAGLRVRVDGIGNLRGVRAARTAARCCCSVRTWTRCARRADSTARWA